MCGGHERLSEAIITARNYTRPRRDIVSCGKSNKPSAPPPWSSSVLWRAMKTLDLRAPSQPVFSSALSWMQNTIGSDEVGMRPSNQSQCLGSGHVRILCWCDSRSRVVPCQDGNRSPRGWSSRVCCIDYWADNRADTGLEASTVTHDMLRLTLEAWHRVCSAALGDGKRQPSLRGSPKSDPRAWSMVTLRSGVIRTVEMRRRDAMIWRSL